MPVIVTLADGREVPDDNPEWRDECLARLRHVQNLQGRPLSQRREYLRELERSEGAEIALRVADAYASAWQQRRQALVAVAQGLKT